MAFDPDWGEAGRRGAPTRPRGMGIHGGLRLAPEPRVRITTLALPVILAVGLSSTACVPTVRSASAAAVEAAVPAAADTSLRMAEDQKTRARVAAALATPEMQSALQSLSSGLVQGAVKGLSSDEISAHVDKMVGQFVHAFMIELAKGIDGDVGPALSKVTKGAVDGAFDAAMSPEHQAKIAAMIAATVASAMRAVANEIPATMAPAFKKAMADDIGPAVREMMARDLAPGMAAMVRSPELKNAMGETAREIARQAVLGSNEGFAELAEKREHDKGGNPLGVVGTFFMGRTWLLAALTTALVLAIPIAWLTRERRLSRKQQLEIERRNARASALLGAMEAAPDGRWPSELLAMLREQLLDETPKNPRGERAGDDPPPPSRQPPRARHA
ncbi:MAG: hypothetical protein JST00_43850 [Deltaproteobacteria bacterium]|nr:hypothetical protein [Deltaproteobacteria bacterium]